MSDITQTFLKEVDDALHEERIINLWRTYKVYILSGVAGLVLAVAANQGWQAYQHRVAQQVAEQWNSLGNKDAAARAVVLETVAAQGSTGFQALARSEQARDALAATPPALEKARTAYTQITDNGSAPTWLASLARLNRAVALMGTDPAAARADATALATPNNPFYPLALELLATLAATEGDTATARTTTEQILALPNIPADMRQRASIRLGALGTLN
ncbi:MAG: tetratricopeptide repeat protein [Alphaproteobacteria bacterium]